MMSAIERAADLLFGEGRSTQNIRFLCGGDSNVVAEQLAQQIVRSEAQIQGGQARLIGNVDEHLAALLS